MAFNFIQALKLCIKMILENEEAPKNVRHISLGIQYILHL